MRKFDEEINKYKKENEKLGLQKDAIVLYGSSTFTIWRKEDIERDLADYKIINRGFGGSHADIALDCFEETVFPLNPRAVFYYEGSNDVALGQSPEESFANTVKTHERLKEQNPEIVWIFLLIHFCPGRKEFHETYRKLNRMYMDFCKQNENCFFIDPKALLSVKMRKLIKLYIWMTEFILTA